MYSPKRARPRADDIDSSDDELSDKDVAILNNAYDDFDDQFEHIAYEDFAQSPRSQVLPASNGSSKIQRSTASARTTANRSRTQRARGNVEAYVEDNNVVAENGWTTPTHSNRHFASTAYSQRPHRRPLIDLVTNEWRKDLANSTMDPSSDHPDCSLWKSMLCAPRITRTLATLFMLTFIVWGNWKTWGSSDENALDIGKYAKDTGPQLFGRARHPDFDDTIHLQHLDPQFLPFPGDGRRLIFIGDVHGCVEELHALLLNVSHRPETDHVIFTGDMIDKGPSTPKVVDTAMAINASCVRGNHEDRYLWKHRERHRNTSPRRQILPAVLKPLDAQTLRVQRKLITSYQRREGHELQKPLTPEDMEAQKKNKKKHDSSKDLTAHHVNYLNHCPVILTTGRIDPVGPLYIVHGGLVPGVSLEDQDDSSVMTMRTMNKKTHMPSDKHKGTPWFEVWNKAQTKLAPSERATVIYGHDSKRGLQIHEFSKGLDSSCVAGGSLSALVLDPSLDTPLVTHSVPCKAYK